MDRLAAMTTFARVVEAGSLTAAARALGTSLASVSRQLAALEDRLGARLMNRTTRRLMLTEGGRSYYERCRRILGDVAEAEAALSHYQAQPAGRLVVSAPVIFGRHYLAPALPAFLARYPGLSIDLTMVDRYVNLVEEGVDAAIRIGALGDSSLVARRLGVFRRVVCGAPRYLARQGTPRAPGDLVRHSCLVFSMLVDADRWHFMAAGRALSVAVAGCLRSNNQDALIDAALHGAGLILAPSWLVRGPVAAGRLRPVLEGFEPPPTPIHAVFPHARLLSAKLRVFVDYLVERWKNEDFSAMAGLRAKAATPGSTGGTRHGRR